MSQSDPFHLIWREPFLGPIAELGRPWALVGGHFLRVLQPAAIREIDGDARGAEGMAANRRRDPAAAARRRTMRQASGWLIDLSNKTLLLCPRAGTTTPCGFSTIPAASM